MQSNDAEMNRALKAMGIDEYHVYRVVWADGKRGVHQKQLSCLGDNISDMDFEAEDGGNLPVLRTSNLDEKLGIVSAKHIHVVDSNGERITLQSMLQNANKHADYMLSSVDAKPAEDEKVVFRVQTTFVPFAKNQKERKLAPRVYCYQAKREDDPRNAIFGGTAQSLHAHADLPGKFKLMAHSKHEGVVNEHWFTAEPMQDTLANGQRGDDPVDPKKAKAVEIGLEGMGPVANLFVVTSIPNRQKPVTYRGSLGGMDDAPVYRSLSGVTHSARMSVDEAVVGEKRKRDKLRIEREEDGPIVVTFMRYKTVELPEGAGPETEVNVSPADLAVAVKEMEEMYALAKVHGGDVCKLSQLPAMLHKLEPKHVEHIQMPIAKADPMKPVANALDAFA
jgi:hypothetical protein